MATQLGARRSAHICAMASLETLLEALRASGGVAPLVVALFAALVLHLLLRARAPARPRGPVTLSPGVKARARRRQPQAARGPHPRTRRWSCRL